MTELGRITLLCALCVTAACGSDDSPSAGAQETNDESEAGGAGVSLQPGGAAAEGGSAGVPIASAGDAGAPEPDPGSPNTAGNANAAAGAAGQGGAGYAPLELACPSPSVETGTSTRCGDGLRDLVDEECDAPASSHCSADCRVLETEPFASAPSSGQRSGWQLAASPRPVAGSCENWVSVAVSPAGDCSLMVASPQGSTQLQQYSLASAVEAPLGDAAIEVMANGSYALAWTNAQIDGSGSGIALSRFSPPDAPELVGGANETTTGAQERPDLVWSNGELVAAWVDRSVDPAGDVAIRKFSPELRPISGQRLLASSSAAEVDPRLTRFGDGWAIAWREISAGALLSERLVLWSGGQTWRTESFGVSSESGRPALLELDDRHLLLVFAKVNAAEPSATRLHFALLDSAMPGELTSAPVSEELGSAESQPSLARVGDTVWLAWRSEDDTFGEDVWLRALTWHPDTGLLDTAAPSMPLPREVHGRDGEQQHPFVASARVQRDTLIVSWDDLAWSDSSAGPRVVQQLLPTPLVSLEPEGNRP